MKLNTFDGGLSVRVDPSLVLPNEGVVYSNIDNTSIVLKSAKGITDLSEIISGYFYFFNNEWLSSDDERSYVEYKDFLYYTETNKRPKKYEGNRETFMGIEAPTIKLTATQADPDASEKISESASTLQYVYTYYNAQDGVESPPSPISDELELAADKVVDLTGFVASTDVQVDTIRVYRIGDGTTTMTLVLETANVDTTVRDDILTLDLPGTLLDSYNNQPALTGLQYLTEAYGIMFAALGDKLYFSQIGKPDYWPTANFIDFARNITGILPVPNGLLIHQRYRTDILIGTRSADFRVLPVSKEQGSIAHLSGKLVKNIPVWASSDGICSYVSGIVKVVSKDKLGKKAFDVVNAAVLDENYYLCLADGTLAVMDARFGVSFKNFAFTTKIDNILASRDILYARKGDFLATLFTGDDVEFNYKSPVLTEGEHTVTKLYNNIYIRCSGDIEIKVLIDGKEVIRKNLTGDKIFDITPPQEKQRGSNIQFDISGTGKVYEIEYKVVGRQNGR